MRKNILAITETPDSSVTTSDGFVDYYDGIIFFLFTYLS